MSLVKAVVNLFLVLLMALLTVPALVFLWIASIPAGYVKKQLPKAGLTKSEVDSLRDHARLRISGSIMAGDFDVSDDDFAKELEEVLGNDATQWKVDMTRILDAVKQMSRPLETLGDPEE